MKKSKMAIVALCAFAFVGSAFATIQPTRVGPVSQYGALQAGKNSAGEGRIYGSVQGVKDGAEVQVRGMSLTWSIFWPNGMSFYGNSFIDSLVGEWNVELVRSAMGSVGNWGQGNYKTRPEYYSAQMDTVVQAAIRNDVYVLVDWHSEGGYYNCIHKGVKPKYEFNDNKACFTASDAAKFFGTMAQRYGKYPHVIFEIYNEPVSESWNDLKAYADTVVQEIRKYSDNLIVVGTPMWSSAAGDAVANPVVDKNVAYTHHFYANMHNINETSTSQNASPNKAIAAGLSVFVTEWGWVEKDINDAKTKANADAFLKWVDEKKLSTAKWDVEKPYLEDNDDDNYIKANVLPQKTTYTKNLDWASQINDDLPFALKTTSTDATGEWSFITDVSGSDEQGDHGNSSFEDNSENGMVKMDKIKLDTVGTAFDYAPYVNADFTFNFDISKCKMFSYRYKGTNHQFVAYSDWNTSTEILGQGLWDYPFVGMPYSPEWTTAYVDFGWMVNNGWQADVPTIFSTKLTTALRFSVTNIAFGDYLWIDSLKCVENVSNYTVMEIPDVLSIPTARMAARNFVRVNTDGLNIVATGVKNGSHYSLSNVLGQTLRVGVAKAGNFSMTAPRAGRYILRIGNSVYPVTVK